MNVARSRTQYDLRTALHFGQEFLRRKYFGRFMKRSTQMRSLPCQYLTRCVGFPTSQCSELRSRQASVLAASLPQIAGNPCFSCLLPLLAHTQISSRNGRPAPSPTASYLSAVSSHTQASSYHTRTIRRHAATSTSHAIICV